MDSLGKDQRHVRDSSFFSVGATALREYGASGVLHMCFPFCLAGQQVVEEMLDAQRPGCIPEYFNMLVPKCHPLYDPDCRGDLFIPFLRNRYDFNTGYAPNNPRMQLNEITPWFDGGLMYGPFKAWADVIRRFQGGELASMNNEEEIYMQFPQSNEEIGLPFANPPPPANNTLFEVNRFFSKLQFPCTLNLFYSDTHCTD